jgi:hypothetical protein
MPSNVSARGASISAHASLARRGFVAFLSAVALFAIACSPASATVGHRFADQIAGPGNDDGQFSGGPSGIAVLPSTGDIYASDPYHTLVDGVTPDPRIERFDGSGAFEDAFSIDANTYNSPAGLAVDAMSGAVYVTAFDNSFVPHVLKYNAAGVFQYALDASSANTTFNYIGAAVDAGNGRVYVSAFDNDHGAPRIDVFDSATGAFIESFDGSANSPSGPMGRCPIGNLAVDSAHRIYVTDCTSIVVRYTSAGAFDAMIDDGSVGHAVDATVDPSSGAAFVAERGPTEQLQIASYAGTTRGQVFDASTLANVAQLAVDPMSGTVYAADNYNGVIARFTTFDGPTPTTDAAAPIAASSATLNGTIDPGGVAADYHFEYGLDTRYGMSTDTTSAGSGSGAVPASAAISGLTPNQTYHYRIVGTNAGGSIPGADHTLTTSSVVPTIVGTPSASSMASTSVRIHGVVNPNHTQTGWHVDYGTDTTYGSSSGSDQDVGGGTADMSVDVNIDGLQPATTYHYRVTAGNDAGAAHGPDGTFRTAPAAPASAIDVTTEQATLVGTIDPRGVATTFHFEYGLGSYALKTAETAGGSSSGEKTVTAAISALRPSTTYHVRVVATSGSDTWYGADGTFTTPPVPTNTVSAATGVSTTTATLNGTVDTHGAAGSYQFEVSSLDSAYTLVSPERALSAATGVRGVAEAVSGLPAGETFTVRLLSNSQDGTGYSDQVTFATAPALAPRAFPTPPSATAIGAYGCAAPRLDAYDRKPDPGDVIAITGSDLGVGGTVSLGSASLTPADWTSAGFSITVPDDAGGTLPLTINCGNVSNTVAVAIFHAPSNKFSITKSLVSRTTATLSVKVPGPGKVDTSASGAVAAKKTATKAGTTNIAVKLSSAGKKALANAKSGKLKVSVKVRFTPAGGTAATLTKTLTFKTGSKR